MNTYGTEKKTQMKSKSTLGSKVLDQLEKSSQAKMALMEKLLSANTSAPSPSHELRLQKLEEKQKHEIFLFERTSDFF